VAGSATHLDTLLTPSTDGRDILYHQLGEMLAITTT
jgi:hypothetical protein